MGDRVSKIIPLPLDKSVKDSIASILRVQIHPFISDLRIGSASVDEGQILYVHIPSQADSAKPFIVEGSGISELGKGGVFSIPVRNRDRSM
jgi:hypothetical protein